MLSSFSNVLFLFHVTHESQLLLCSLAWRGCKEQEPPVGDGLAREGIPCGRWAGRRGNLLEELQDRPGRTHRRAAPSPSPFALLHISARTEDALGAPKQV